MTALQLRDEQVFEPDTTVVPFTGKLMDPATAEPQGYVPPPDAVLPGETPIKKRRGRTPGSKNKAKAKKSKASPASLAPVEGNAPGDVGPIGPSFSPAPGVSATDVASVPGGKSPFLSAPVPKGAGWIIGAMMLALTVGAAIGFWALR